MARALAFALWALLTHGCYLAHAGSFDAPESGAAPDAGLTLDAASPPRSDAGAADAGARDAGSDAGVLVCDEPGAITPEERCALGCDEDLRCDPGAPCCRICICGPRVRVESGEYSRGSPLDEAGREADEVRHRVRITRAFEMDRTEVTQEEWARHMASTPANRTECPRCPVEQVNRYEAMLFANARSQADGLPRCYDFTAADCSMPIGTGCPPERIWNRCDGPFCTGARPASLECMGWRLPTEAEWEYAARAGSDTAFLAGNDESLANVHGWCGAAEGMSHPVGLKPANPFGLLDIIGNVYEWTADEYAPYPSDPPPLVDPIATRGRGGVIRGGSFAFGDSYCRSANRGARAPTSRENILGFRLVRTLP